MQPYATASEPSPLNGNRPNVNGNNSFFTEYRTQILYSIGFVIFVVFVAVSTRGKYSWYETKKKKSKKDKKKARSVWKKAAATLEKKPKKDKKGSKVKPAGKCPAGCVPAGVEKKKGPNLSKTSFDPALTNKKPKVEGTPQ
jgi:hypothetical protein|tara:strand:- start:234 stop:656 length:423 start_codon:yes stop_codon:yes gene_type:complete